MYAIVIMPMPAAGARSPPVGRQPPAIGHLLAGILGVVVGLVPVSDEEGGGFVRRVVDLLRFRSRNPTVRRGFGASTRPSLCSDRPFSVARDPSPCPCATPPAGEAALAMARYSASLTRPARHSVSRVAWSHSRRLNVLVCRQRFNLAGRHQSAAVQSLKDLNPRVVVRVRDDGAGRTPSQSVIRISLKTFCNAIGPPVRMLRPLAGMTSTTPFKGVSRS